tara:strand:- start:236 stop:1405 length:1170 start_codon:yes stop_codon:yes gene_type:complete
MNDNQKLNQNAFDDIWKIHPELQNNFSSAWWFFLLFPDQEEGYGPKQLMFAFASKAGKNVGVRNIWQKGMNIKDLKKENEQQKFMTTLVGWIFDGDNVHEGVIHQKMEVELSDKGYLIAKDDQNENNIIAKLIGDVKDYFKIDAEFANENTSIKFEANSSNDPNILNPQLTMIQPKFVNKLFNVNVVTWKKFDFKGDFKTLNFNGNLSGIGYFQRVLFNGPLIPWTWLWIVFENGNVLSSFIPFFGFQNFRRKDKFYSTKNENKRIKINPTSYFIIEGKYKRELRFNKIDIELLYSNKKVNEELPRLNLKLSNNENEWLEVNIMSNGHAQFHLERGYFKNIIKSKWSYNEYMIKVNSFSGVLNGIEMNELKKEMGNGWGNMEYTYGMSI